MTIRSLTRLLAVIGVALLVGACGSQSVTPSPSVPTPVPTTPASTPTQAATSSLDPTAAPSANPSANMETASGLVILGASGDTAIWGVGPLGRLVQLSPAPKATAIASTGEGIVLGDSEKLEFRAAGSVVNVARTVSLMWPKGTSPVRAIAVSPSGQIAITVGSEGHISYALVTAEGRIGTAQSPSSQPFSPLVGWLDETRRVVLTTDAAQQSRLATWSGSSDFSSASGNPGCRWFALSGDGGTLAVVTETQISAGKAANLLGGKAATQVAAIADGVVAWGTTLNRDGSKLALLEGKLADDGSVSDIRDVIYVRSADAWHLALEVPMNPLTRILGQAWAN